MNLQMTSNFLSFYSFVNVPNKLGYKCERSRSNRGKAVQLLLRQQDIIERMDKITALGIVINNRLTATDHISFVLTACSSLLYVLRVLRIRGLPEPSVKDVFQATVFPKIMYCLPAWFGFCTAADRNWLDSFLRRCVRLGLWSSSNTPCVSTIAEDIENTLFNKITCYHYYILQSYLPDRPDINYNLREHHYNKTLIFKTAVLNKRDFLIRDLYKRIYWL